MSEPAETISRTVTVLHDCTAAEVQQAADVLGGIKKPMRGRARLLRGLFGWVLFFFLSIMLFVLIQQSGPNPQSSSQIIRNMPIWVWKHLNAAHFVFLIGFGFVVAGVFVLRHADLLRAHRWHGQFYYTFDERGLTSQRPHRRDTFVWRRYLGFDETPNLFILRESPNAGIVIPKRLFVSDDDVRFVSTILHREFEREANDVRGHGFEVITR